MHTFLQFTEKTETNALVAFTDITKFTVTCQNMPDLEVARWMDEYFRITQDVVAEAGGIVVKYIGDAALIVFSEEQVDQGIEAMLKLKEKVDEWMIRESKPSRLEVQVHFGPLVAGPFLGPQGNSSFDVLGKTVNTARLLQANPFAISPQAFRKLSPECRQNFKKHTPPITYIRTSDRH